MTGDQEPIRLLNLGPTGWLRTQSVYRSTAEMMDAAQPDTVVMSTPVQAYIAVGGGHKPEMVLDLDECLALDLPVIPSPLSSPRTLFDDRMLVFQWVFSDEDGLADAMLDGAAETLKTLGLKSVARTGDQLLVEDRPLVQTQAGSIGQASIVQGDIFFQISPRLTGLMAGGPPRTALWEELPRPISPEMLHTALLGGFARALGRPIERGRPRQVETRASKRIDLELLKQAGDLLGKDIVMGAKH